MIKLGLSEKAIERVAQMLEGPEDEGPEVQNDPDAQALADKLVGNWQSFQDFSWGHSGDEDSQNWAVVYTSNRDSDIMTRSNAKAIEKIMSKFPEDQVRPESHGHWAVGNVDGYAIRVYEPDGSLTPAFLAWADIQQQLDEYPILDETGLGEMESEELMSNLADALQGASSEDERVQDYLDSKDSSDLAYDFRTWADEKGIDMPSDYYPDKRVIERWIQESVAPQL
jgi:hypothetical protein